MDNVMLNCDLIDRDKLIAMFKDNELSTASISTISDKVYACAPIRNTTYVSEALIQLHPMTCVNCGGSIDTRSMTCRFCGTEYLSNVREDEEDYSIYESF